MIVPLYLALFKVRAEKPRTPRTYSLTDTPSSLSRTRNSFLMALHLTSIKKVRPKAHLKNLVADIRQQSDVSCTFDGKCEFSLVLCASTGDSSGKNLASFGNILAKLCNILEINRFRLFYAEIANLLALFAGAERLLSRCSRCRSLLYNCFFIGVHTNIPPYKISKNVFAV